MGKLEIIETNVIVEVENSFNGSFDARAKVTLTRKPLAGEYQYVVSSHCDAPSGEFKALIKEIL